MKLRNELVGIEQKLDALLDLQLTGALSPEEYVAQKAKLLNQKTDISEKITASTQKSDNRFEPLIKFLKTLSQAEKIAVQENPEGIRDFLKKIGSNFHIAERRLTCQLQKPWYIARKWHMVLLGDRQNSVISGKSANWRREQDSNLRGAHAPTRVPGVRLKPLGHLSR